MANKRMIILLYTDPIGYADSPPLSEGSPVNCDKLSAFGGASWACC